MLMPVGSKFKIFLPYDLGFGAGARGRILPYSVLVYDIELVDIAKTEPVKGKAKSNSKKNH